MINYNLAGRPLLHCVKVPAAKLLMADDDPEFVSRIDGVRETLEGEYGMEIVIMNPSTKAEIRSQKAEKVDDVYRKVVKGDWPMCLFYTRFVGSQTDRKALILMVSKRHNRHAKSLCFPTPTSFSKIGGGN